MTHAEASLRPVNLYRAAHVKLRQGEVVRLGRSSCGTCAGRVAPGALPEGAVSPLPLELRGLCKGAYHLCALPGGAITPLPLEMRKESARHREAGHGFTITGK